MNVKHYFLIIVGAVILSACGKGLSTSEIESRVIGKWEFENVEFKDKGSLHKKDVSGNWTDYSLEFFLDGTIHWIDRSISDTMLGYWYINESIEWNSNSQSNEVIQKMELYIYSNTSSDVRFMRWEELAITNSKLRAQEKTAKGRYYFKLKR